MKRIPRFIAAAEISLIAPAVLFMAALFVRELEPRQFQPAHAAQAIVDWFASSSRIGLWVLLISLPLAVFIIGSLLLRANWRGDAEFRQAAHAAFAALIAHWPAFLVTVATVTSAGILAIVAFHALTN